MAVQPTGDRADALVDANVVEHALDRLSPEHRAVIDVELWDTWIVGAPIAGKDVTTTLTVAVIDDPNHDGIYNDAPCLRARCASEPGVHP